MKKLTKLAVAVSLILAAGNASASWIDGTTVGTPSSVAFQIGSGTNTFVLDLAQGHTGLNYASFQNGTEGVAGGLSWDLGVLGGSLFSAIAANTASFKWSVIAGYQVDDTNGTNLDKSGTGAIGAPFTDPNNAQWGAQTTAHATTDLTTQGYTNIQAEVSNTGKIGSWLALLNAPYNGNGAPVESLAAVGTSSYYDTNLADLATLGGNQSFIGTQTAKYFGISNNNLDGLDNQIAQLGTFSLSSGNILSYSAVGAPPAAVPVPAAVWLFGSAMLGMLGFTRRNNAKGLAA
jgi:hypothetical protein